MWNGRGMITVAGFLGRHYAVIFGGWGNSFVRGRCRHPVGFLNVKVFMKMEMRRDGSLLPHAYLIGKWAGRVWCFFINYELIV